MSQTETVYAILKKMGNDVLRDYIKTAIPTTEFDSHAVTNMFRTHFPELYERMLNVHSRDRKLDDIRFVIANRIGIYLGRNRESLGVEKIGTRMSLNLNRKTSRTSLWRKTE